MSKYAFWIYGLIVALLVVGAITLEVYSWNECLDTNSFWYCFRL